MYKICLIEGDGIGQEVIESAKKVLLATSLPFEFSYAQAGYACYQKIGTSIPDETVNMARKADATLFGAVTSPPNIANYKSAIITLRRELDLFANIRPTQSFPIQSSRDNIDMVIVRENTEDLYIGDEEIFDGYAIAKRKISQFASERIVTYACELAIRENRPKVTIVHKANVLRATDGLFLRTALEVMKKFPQLESETLIVDTVAMRLIQDPEHFSVIVTTNMFGDILSDEACALVGGLGLAASGNIGEKNAIFEPVHGSAPDIAGQGIANPIATILAAAMMLEHLNLQEEAAKIRDSVIQTLQSGVLPMDLGGNKNTQEITNSIIHNMVGSKVS